MFHFLSWDRYPLNFLEMLITLHREIVERGVSPQGQLSSIDETHNRDNILYYRFELDNRCPVVRWKVPHLSPTDAPCTFLYSTGNHHRHEFSTDTMRAFLSYMKAFVLSSFIEDHSKLFQIGALPFPVQWWNCSKDRPR